MATPRSAPHTPVMDAHDSGMEAQRVGVPLTENPHPVGTAECAAWATGWRTQMELDREFPEDPVEDLLAEVRATVRRQEVGLDRLLERINHRAKTLADMLALRAPEVVLEDQRAGLRKWTDALLARKAGEVGP